LFSLTAFSILVFSTAISTLCDWIASSSSRVERPFPSAGVFLFHSPAFGIIMYSSRLADSISIT
jgi:hypothetical protein